MEPSESKENCPGLLIHEHLNKKVNYITKEVVDRQFEVQVREDLVKAYAKMQNTVSKKRQKIRFTALSFPKEFSELRLCDILHDLGDPKTTEEMMSSLAEMSKATETQNGNLRNPITGLPPLPPTTKQGFVTPVANRTPMNPMHTLQSVFGVKVLPSTLQKQARPARPGEAVFVFSATGSPVLPDSVPSSSSSSVSSDGPSRVRVPACNGELFEVDLVFRGAPEKIRNQIVTDFRCWARSRSAMQTRKILPQRPIGRKNATSLNKKQKL